MLYAKYSIIVYVSGDESDSNQNTRNKYAKCSKDRAVYSEQYEECVNPVYINKRKSSGSKYYKSQYNIFLMMYSCFRVR